MITTEYKIQGPTNLTIAIVADLHEREPDEVLSILHTIKPDIIAVPGDLLENYSGVCRESEEDEGENWLGRMVSHIIHSIDYNVEDRCRRHRSVGSRENAYRFLTEAGKIAPVLYSCGNHERFLTEEDEAVLHSAGIHLLNNSSVVIGGILFGGIPSKQSAKIDEEFLDSFSSHPGYKVLLSHHPEYYEKIKPYNINLILAGHAHGGQIRVCGRGLYSPGQGCLPRHTKGVFENRLVVSAGCSNTAAIPRICNPCEVVVVRVEK